MCNQDYLCDNGKTFSYLDIEGQTYLDKDNISILAQITKQPLKSLARFAETLAKTLKNNNSDVSTTYGCLHSLMKTTVGCRNV